MVPRFAVIVVSMFLVAAEPPGGSISLKESLGYITGAITDLRQLLTDQQRVLGPGHPLTMTTRAHLARWEELAALQRRLALIESS